MTCDYFARQGITVESEAEWREKHKHGKILVEAYKGVQPPTYKLEQLRCLFCNAVMVRQKAGAQ